MQMLADLGALVVDSIVKNSLGNLDLAEEKKSEILQIASSLKEVI